MSTVRDALPADVAALARLAAVTFPLACPPHTTDESKAAFIATHLSETSFAGYVADPARDVLVADQDGELAGYVMLVAGDPADADVAAAVRIRPTVELSKCYVHPDSHGGGVASELMGAALERASARSASGIWLGVNQLNARAQRFYGKHGFTRVGVKRFLVGESYEDDFVYERAL
ncbi:N-acetyltransferase [Homoserinibacter sp. GY 40078]|uniref:GNAT family N-acetyltransferase n=1 Tax=Homoserinibacter sp. GY 40078 TaxID=2603275 RepID=UPI0011CB8D29|nr:GNAT family N-acetyltransferase [Homoserinibacter sp. GY 40078]TXK18514.1 GNAT family N-acetyltransferase [Homoserinibacter sp. GY 40078]